MITEDYVSLKVAKLLKEKGFDEECISYYQRGENVEISYSFIYERNSDWVDGSISAPTLQMAMKWLRKVHNLDIIATPQFDNSKWTYSAIIFNLSIPCTETRLNDNKDKKEQACEAAIKYCLENLI